MNRKKRIALILVPAAAAAAALLALAARYVLRAPGMGKGLGGMAGKIPAQVEEADPPRAGEADWPNWRGAGFDNRSRVSGLRTDWSGGLRKVWEIDYLCQGDGTFVWTTPVVRGNRLVVMGRDLERDHVFCLDPATGDLLWHRSFEAPTGNGHGSGARGTPFMDGERVYTYGRGGDLVCWRLDDGKRIWRANVEDAGGEDPGWGHASSPLVYDGKVVVQSGGDAYAIAYDKGSGCVAWKATASNAGKPGYAAPVLADLAGRRQLLLFYRTGLVALDPGSGDFLWHSPWKTPWGVNATTPVVSGDSVFITSGYGTGCELVIVGPGGATVVWKNKVIASHHSDPILIDGDLYGYSGQSTQNAGDFVCVELATGKEKWRTKEIGWGTVVHVNDLLVCLDIRGNLFLVKPDPKRFRKITELRGAVPVAGRHAWTIPIVANGKLYLRYLQRLVCYDLVGS